MSDAVTNNKSSVGNATIRGLLQGAVGSGYDPQTILEKAGLQGDLYNDPKSQINGVEFQQLIRAIIEEMDDIMMGFTNQPARTAMSGYMIKEFSTCETLHEHLKTYAYFRRAMREDIGYDLQIDNRRHEVSWKLLHQPRKDLDPSWFYWYLLLSNYLTLCRQLGERFPLKKVCFSFGSPAADIISNNYTAFGCNVFFNQPDNKIVFDQKFLRRRLANTVIPSMNFFTFPEKWETSLVERVENALRDSQMKDNWSASLPEIAAKLSLGERTLRRQLARENESFTQIKARLRAEQAKYLLQHTDTPITHIASQIGFSDPGDFTRAFRRWTQYTPSDYRKKYR